MIYYKKSIKTKDNKNNVMNFLKELKRYLKSEWYNLKNYHKIKFITLLLIIIFFPITLPLIIIGFILDIITEIVSGKKEYDKSIYKLITKKSYFSIQFYNPIIQNRNHIKALANILEIKDVNIFRSYIVFILSIISKGGC